MLRRGVWFLSIVLVSVAALLVGRWYATVQAQGSPRPFVIEMQEQALSGDNPPRLLGEYHSVRAVRSDGSRVYANIEKRADSSWRILSRRAELVSERKFVLTLDASQLVSIFPMSSGRATQLVSAWGRTECEPRGYNVVAEDFIQGYRVIKLERERPNSRWQEWLAPDLACHALRLRYEEKRPDRTVAFVSEQMAVSIREGEPPAELFDVSKNYVEVPPSQLLLRGAPAQTASEDLQKKLQKIDDAYHNLNTNPPR